MRSGIGLRAATIAGLAFLWFPLLLIVVYAFTSDDVVLEFPPPSYTTRWFGVAADNPEIWSSLWLSVRVALIAT
ncbi:MAG: ABC transporter permease, partial [Acidimicrobiia bacterium]|nr:ABC transporter permease [Acidimicrobiia bacterium]